MEIALIIIVAISVIMMIVSIVFDWKLKIGKFNFALYWIICLVGAIISMILLYVFKDPEENPFMDIFFREGAVNPLKILIIFISCTSISVLLDKIGFFSYIAAIILKKSKSSQTKLFFSFSAVIAILTIFTSNDILILTFTPFICYFSKNAKINPLPYIISEFVCANVWSMFFFIDNPTNIYMCQSFGIEFLPYAAQMAIPTAICGVFSTFLVYLIFRKDLKIPMTIEEAEIVKPDSQMLIMGLVGLGIMVTLMAVSNYIPNVELWYVPLVCSVITYIVIAVALIFRKDKRSVGYKMIWDALKSLPYALIPFLLSMSVFVAALEKANVMQTIAGFLADKHSFLTGFIAFFSGNALNNIPMSMMFTSIMSKIQEVGTLSNTTIYSVVAASNITALLTPIGSLAGIMFMKILKQNDVKYTFGQFVIYGSIISIPTMALALLILTLLPIAI